MLLVMVDAGLADPPRRLLGRFAELAPRLAHPRPAGVRLGPGHIPRLIAHRLEERRVQPVDVDIVTLVGAGLETLELDACFCEPCPDVADDVADRPGRIDVIAGRQTLLER